MPNRMFTLNSQEIDVTCERLFLFCVRHICNSLQQLHWFVLITIHQTFVGLMPGRQYLRSVLSRRFHGLASIGAALGGIIF